MSVDYWLFRDTSPLFQGTGLEAEVCACLRGSWIKELKCHIDFIKGFILVYFVKIMHVIILFVSEGGKWWYCKDDGSIILAIEYGNMSAMPFKLLATFMNCEYFNNF